MSTKKMVADSTVTSSELPVEGRKRKKSSESRRRKKSRKSSSKDKKKEQSRPADSDSDLDLGKELKPMGGYLKDRQEMMEQMFHAVRGPSLQRALPDILRDLPLEELKQRCLEQLEIMSRKRIRRILEGDNPAEISSSGTEEESTESTGDEQNKGEQSVAEEGVEGSEAENSEGTLELQEEDGTPVGSPASEEGVEDDSDGGEEGVEVDDEDENSEEPHKEESDHEEVEVMEGSEEVEDSVQEAGGSEEEEDRCEEQVDKENSEEEMPDGQDDGCDTVDDGPSADGAKAGKSPAPAEGGSGLSLAPVLTLAQMEILELEMRARAIKAMLRKQPPSKSTVPEKEEKDRSDRNRNESDLREKRRRLEESPNKDIKTETKIKRSKQSRKKKGAVRAREEGKRASEERTVPVVPGTAALLREISKEETVVAKIKETKTVIENNENIDVKVKVESSSKTETTSTADLHAKSIGTGTVHVRGDTTDVRGLRKLEDQTVELHDDAAVYERLVTEMAIGDTPTREEGGVKSEDVMVLGGEETRSVPDSRSNFTGAEIKTEYPGGQTSGTVELPEKVSREENMDGKSEDNVTEPRPKNSTTEVPMTTDSTGGQNDREPVLEQQDCVSDKTAADTVAGENRSSGVQSSSEPLSRQPDPPSDRMEGDKSQIDQKGCVKQVGNGPELDVQTSDSRYPCATAPLSEDTQEEESEVEEGEVISDCDA